MKESQSLTSYTDYGYTTSEQRQAFSTKVQRVKDDNPGKEDLWKARLIG